VAAAALSAALESEMASAAEVSAATLEALSTTHETTLATMATDRATEVTALETALAMTTAEVAELHTALSAAQSASAAGIAGQLEITAILEGNVAQLTADVAVAREQRDDAQGELGAARAAGEALRSEAAAIATAQHAHLAALEEEHAADRAEIEGVATTLRECRETETAEYTAMLATKDAEIAEQARRIVKLDAAKMTQQMVDKFTELKKAKKALKKTNSALEKKLKALAKKLTMAQASSAKESSEEIASRESLGAEISELRAALTEAKESSARAEEAHSRSYKFLEKENYDLLVEGQASEATIETLKEKLKAAAPRRSTRKKKQKQQPKAAKAAGGEENGEVAVVAGTKSISRRSKTPAKRSKRIAERAALDTLVGANAVVGGGGGGMLGVGEEENPGECAQQ